MSHTCIMATANNLRIRSIPSEVLSLYSRAYAEFNLSKRKSARHPGLLTRYTNCPECGLAVGGELVATELLRQLAEYEQGEDPRSVVAGAGDAWAATMAKQST